MPLHASLRCLQLLDEPELLLALDAALPEDESEDALAEDLPVSEEDELPPVSLFALDAPPSAFAEAALPSPEPLADGFLEP